MPFNPLAVTFLRPLVPSSQLKADVNGCSYVRALLPQKILGNSLQMCCISRQAIFNHSGVL